MTARTQIGKHTHFLQLRCQQKVTGYVAIGLDMSRIKTHCDLEPLEIIGFAISEALAPWVCKPVHGDEPRFVTPISPREATLAITAFRYDSGPLFSATIGALTARPIAGMGILTDCEQNDASLAFETPSGNLFVKGRSLANKEFHDHWLAHRKTSATPSLSPIGLHDNLLLSNLASVLYTCHAPNAPDANEFLRLDPEVMLKALLPLYDKFCIARPRNCFDSWNAVRRSEQRLCQKGVLRENPIGPNIRWQHAPNYSQAITSLPEEIVDFARRFDDLITRVPPNRLETAAKVIIEDLGGTAYSSEHDATEVTAHMRVAVVPVIHELEELGDGIINDEIVSSFFLTNNPWL